MLAKQIIFILNIVITTLIHGASENISAALTTSSKPIMHDFIGFASGKAGSCMLHTPGLVEPGKDFPITVVYTEMPELKSEETLSKILALFAKANQSPDFFKESFDETLLKMIKDLDIKSDNFGETGPKLNLDAIILCINLSQLIINSFCSRPEYRLTPQLKYYISARSAPYQSCDEDATYAEWINGVGHCEYEKPLTCSPQEHAETLLQNSHYAKFALVLNIPQFIQLRDAVASNTKDR